MCQVPPFTGLAVMETTETTAGQGTTTVRGTGETPRPIAEVAPGFHHCVFARLSVFLVSLVLAFCGCVCVAPSAFALYVAKRMGGPNVLNPALDRRQR